MIPDELLSFEDDDRPWKSAEKADEMARVVCLREWLKWVVRERMRVVHLEQVAEPDECTRIATAMGAEEAATYAECPKQGRTPGHV